MLSLSLILITCLLFIVYHLFNLLFNSSKFVLLVCFSVYNLFYLLMDDFYEFFFSYLNTSLLYLIVSFCVCVRNISV